MDTTLESHALTIVSQAKALTITRPADFEAAATVLRSIKAMRTAIAETFDEPIAKAFASHRAAVAAKKKHEAPLIEAEALVKSRMSTFQVEEQRKARELQAKLQQEAQLQQAVAAEQSGDTVQAEAILDGTAPIVPVVIAPNVPKVEGISFRTTWNAEVVDLGLLLDAIVVGQAPLSLLRIDQTALREYARATKGGVSTPGIRFFTESTVSAGSPTPTGAGR